MSLERNSKCILPILTYHSIDTSGSIISTSPKKFRSQMQYVAESSFNVIALKDIVLHIKENRPFPEKSLAITFDDGFKNIYKEAYPFLKEYGFIATVFLVTAYCGKNNKWNGQPKGIPILDLLGWKEIEEMASNGVDFGAHTMNHPNLSELNREQAYKEIANSKKIIQEHIGNNILFFAYPYGGQNREIYKIVKDQFYGACSTGLGFVTLKSDIYSLPRIEMYYFSNNNLFSWLGRPIFPRYIKVRNIIRSLRGQ